MDRKKYLVIVLCALASAPWQASAATQVGFAIREITPVGSLSGICLGGYGSCSCRQATGINDPIYARAMVISNSTTNTTVAIVSLDLVGASNRVIKSIISKANSPAVIIPGTNIIISETHSHSTPDLVGLWGKVTSTYKTYVIDQAAAAIKEAHDNRVTATLSASAGSYSESHNRRGWTSTDQDVVVLDARNASTGARIGTLVNYAAHPGILSSGNKLISRDWVGYMVAAAEASLGAGKVMYVNGAQGDATPKTDVTGGATELERAQRYGEGVAGAVLGAMASAIPVGDSLKLSRQAFNQCVTNQNLLLANVIGLMDYDLLSGRGCPLTGLFASKRLATQVAYLRLGTEIQVAVVPGEALSRMARDGVGAAGFPSSTASIKATMKTPVKAILGLSTDFLGYFVPQDEWNDPKARKNPANGDYEEGVSLGGDQASTWLRDRVKSLITADNATF